MTNMTYINAEHLVNFIGGKTFKKEDTIIVVSQTVSNAVFRNCIFAKVDETGEIVSSQYKDLTLSYISSFAEDAEEITSCTQLVH